MVKKEKPVSMSFAVTPEETDLVLKCVNRAVEIGLSNDRLGLAMVLTSVNSNGCPLDFEKLLSFPNEDFGHDIGGMARHLDYSSGKLLDCFLPRCAKRTRFAK